MKEGLAVGAFEGDDVGFELGLGLPEVVLISNAGAKDFRTIGVLVGFFAIGCLVGVKETEGLLLLDGLRVGFLTGALVKNAVGMVLGDAV